jgi:hypothetical protein
MVFNRFGKGPVGAENIHYEADVTLLQSWANRFPRSFRVIYLNLLTYLYRLLPPYPFDNEL